MALFCHAQKEWKIEAEDNASKVTFRPDGVIDIVAPKGLTLWNTNLMQGDVIIEYDARIVTDDFHPFLKNRISDLNCFWMATDPKAKNGSVFVNMNKRKGVFVNQYALQLYYMGYGGNYNKTTRFRRYDGDSRGITDPTSRPGILREYLDADNLLVPDHWYHIRLEQREGRVRYIIDGTTLVDYLDINPFTSGYFGFRTTLSHAQVKNFNYKCDIFDDKPITLKWLNKNTNLVSSPQTFGIPFAKGELKENVELSLLTDSLQELQHDEWILSRWEDGSVKWKAFATVVPMGTDSCVLRKAVAKKKISQAKKVTSSLANNENQIVLTTGSSLIYIPRSGDNIIDSIVTRGLRTVGKVWVELNGERKNVTNVSLERDGYVRSCVKIEGENFVARLYVYKGSDELKIVHTLLVDSTLNSTGLRSLAIRSNSPLRDPNYLRKVTFNNPSSLIPHPSSLIPHPSSLIQYTIQPLIARRPIILDDNDKPTDERSARMISDIASWDGFRLSQLSPNAFSVRKRATSNSPWIGTTEGYRSDGVVSVGDKQSGVAYRMEDFWQSYPSSLQVDNARSDEAITTMWLWSPEAEPMSFEHYDTIAHSLEAAYEDVQSGMSTAYGIARTSTLYLHPFVGEINNENLVFSDDVLLPTPEYLHRKRAFGIWSLRQDDGSEIEACLDSIASFYSSEVERQHWYGFFNYGDVMHTYDRSRGEWRYDVGGYAWDNTELASNAMLWYLFLRSGNPRMFEMARAMSRHTGEVDCYHLGPHAGLGSRHNVTHWGCGAKEARISQAYWNRFLFFLTADERSGDLMHEVVDADQLLYTLDPMRLAQPRSERFPCTAPARLRVGPDWLAYAGNWFTEWERTGNIRYYDKILSGMNSISQMPHGMFSGPKALGYDPATGIITWEGDTAVQNTNHLATIMGGFEMMNEMLFSIHNPQWNATWLSHAKAYKQKALTISQNKFRIPRLQAYAYWKTGNPLYRQQALSELLDHKPFSNKSCIFTNDAATWTLDAIFIKECL